MEMTATASALPSKGVWGSFARKVLEGISAVREHHEQQCVTRAVRELDHPGVFAEMEAAARRHDAAKLQSIFEGYSVVIPE